MSRIRADRYTNREGTGAPTFADGVNVVGISSLGITTVTGVGQTALTVNGDARITGVLTVGQGSVTIGSTNITTQSINNLNYPTAGPLSNRNIIINGAMQVAQRGTTGTSQNGNNNYVVDRFKGIINTSPAVITHSQETTGAPDGFQNWLKVVVTTADTSIGAADYGTIHQHIEGYNFAHVNYGASNAQEVTVSFKFKTNKAGTYCMIHRNNAADRNYIHEFTPVADGNWQTITYTVPGDTTGTWDKTTNIGWRWELCIANGTDFQSSTVGSWFSGTFYHSSPNQVNFLDSTSNELGITGVQLEVGSVATPFEHENYGQTLAKCERYYQIVVQGADAVLGNAAYYENTRVFSVCHLRTTMRAAPSLDIEGNTSSYTIFRNATSDPCNAPSFGSRQQPRAIELDFNSGVSGTAGQAAWIRTGVAGGAGDTAYIAAKAEL